MVAELKLQTIAHSTLSRDQRNQPLHHDQAAQRPERPTSRTRSHHPNGPKADDTPTFSLGHSVGAHQLSAPIQQSNTQHAWIGRGAVNRILRNRSRTGCPMRKYWSRKHVGDGVGPPSHHGFLTPSATRQPSNAAAMTLVAAVVPELVIGAPMWVRAASTTASVPSTIGGLR
jgi:hypothetical protein